MEISHPPQALSIQAHNLWARYDGAAALEDLTFSVESGQRVAVVGPNGAGKTTLFRVIAGVMPASRGSIQVHEHAAGEHVCVGYVPEHTQVNLDFPASVKDVVMMGRVGEIGLLRQPRQADWRAVEHALDSIGMRELETEHFGTLSAGQRQRVFLAQTLAQGAQIVLLDEPLSGLDVPAQEALMEILDQLRRTAVTVLVATHDLNFAQLHFQRVMLLNRRLIAYGEPSAVLTPDHLSAAYGGKLHVVGGDRPLAMVADTHHEGH